MIQKTPAPATRGSQASAIIAFLNARGIYADLDGRIRHNGCVIDLLFNPAGALTLCQINDVDQPWPVVYRHLLEPTA